MSASITVRKEKIDPQGRSNFDTSTQAREKKHPEKHRDDALATTQANKRGAKRKIKLREVEESNDLAGINENDSIGG